MSDLQQREAVKAAYSGPAWQLKVNKMSDAQVTAIYLNLKKQGKV
jgi:hypothetical protein